MKYPLSDPRVQALWRNLLLFLGLNAVVRLGLVLWNQDWSLLLPWKLLPALLIGAMFDAVAGLHLLAAAGLLLALWPAQRVWALKSLPWVWMVLTVPTSLVLAFTALSEFTFWLEFASRFNFVAVDYLVYSQEVLGNIRQSYNLPVLLAIVGALAATLITLQWRWVAHGLARPSELRLPHRLFGALALAFTPVLTFALVDVRYKEFSADAQLNEIAGNGYYDFFHALRSNELDYERLYPVLPEGELVAALAKLYPRADTQQAAATTDLGLKPDSWHRAVRAQRPPRPLNVVMVSIESLGASFMKVHGGQGGLTPELDALAEQGLNFTRLYATGTRTVRGLEALSLSVPPTPGHAIVTRPAHAGLHTLGHVLRDQGYETLYLYGGYSTFDNMKAFFGGNGYTVVDRTAIPADRVHHETIWGVADEDLFTMAIEQLDARHAAGKTFFAHIMTTSNHRPFTYPDGRIDIPSKSGRDGGVKYTDWAIGAFVRAARSRPWFDRTLFVFVADHTHNGRGKQELPPASYHIPMVIYAPGHVAPGVVDSVASQIDVAPTILGLLGQSYDSRFFGQDILGEGRNRQRAFLANYQTVGYYRDGWVVELKPQRRHRVVRVDEGAPDVDRQALLTEAIAHYQLASAAYRRGWMQTGPAAKP